MHLSVLLVEDDVDIRYALEDVLLQEGCNVQTASGAAEALKLLGGGGQDRSPDIILLDLKMPEMSGEEMLPLLARDYPEIPVVVCTAKSLDGPLAHASDFITKPFTMERLMKVLEAHARHSSTMPRRAPFPDA
jgi:CheY-like chemotaxis protein